VTDKRNNSLALLLVLAMLKAKLPNFDSSEKVTKAINFYLSNSVDNGADIVGLSQLDLNSKFFWLIKETYLLPAMVMIPRVFSGFWFNLTSQILVAASC
jgi:hypothetical protein